MYAKHPKIAKRWNKKYGSKIVKKKSKKSKKSKSYNFAKAEKRLGVIS